MNVHAWWEWRTVKTWIRPVLEAAGVSDRVFKAHSMRSASTSKAWKFIPLNKVLAAADWKGPTTFFKHYNRDLLDRGAFAKAEWK